MKKIKILLSLLILSACTDVKKNDLIIPPNYNELPDLESPQENKAPEINPEEIEKLKKMLQESD
jgi:hypothetical protein